ncbi:hypothetical protein L227DRAFT_567464 [Lentinus tigrinus ALCF2SS1-6]|uniref:Uncharacterized protein n=1 Tax=Lentinus tigrinus ALCF2SS1-6 TaxID=1328759 RepID=A0A5C2RR76_9APHY|nr:hypothetical protein L227DRAFT_567464 [Lentinus tigrinus ALCF2SS1-6]
MVTIGLPATKLFLPLLPGPLGPACQWTVSVATSHATDDWPKPRMSSPLPVAMWASPVCLSIRMLFEVVVLGSTALNALDRPRTLELPIIKALHSDGLGFFQVHLHIATHAFRAGTELIRRRSRHPHPSCPSAQSDGDEHGYGSGNGDGGHARTASADSPLEITQIPQAYPYHYRKRRYDLREH